MTVRIELRAMLIGDRIMRGVYDPPKEKTAEAFQAAYFNDLEPEAFEDSLNTNAVGPYWMTFAFLPLLEKWKEVGYTVTQGRKFAPQVIMTSSMNGWTKDPATSGYSFPYMYSKSAIGHATSTLAHELLPMGIRVNGIAPGLFLTEMSVPGATDGTLGEARFTAWDKIKFKVACTQAPPEDGSQPIPAGSRSDVGALVLFLVSNWFVNGETVLIDGGVSCLPLICVPRLTIPSQSLLLHPSSY